MPGVTGLQRYFEDEVVQLQNRLAEEVRAKVAKQQQQQQQQRDSSGPVVFLGGGGGAIIPELHFPNSADGGGMLEHATPQLDAGMQVKERLACVLAGEKVGGVRSLVLLVGRLLELSGLRCCHFAPFGRRYSASRFWFVDEVVVEQFVDLSNNLLT